MNSKDDASTPAATLDKNRKDVKLLVVDDSQTMRMTLGWILEKEYPVAQAVDGLEGVKLYDSFNPDIILLDLNMPRMDGFGVIDHIRRECGDHDTFILVLTAAEGSALKPKALNMGANDFLYKPFDKVELMARIGVAERQVRLTRQLRDYLAKTTREIDLLASLQSRLLPQASPLLPGVKIRSLYRPSGMASGDYFDYFPITGGRLRVVVADVSGHGARAAFIMAIVRTLFRTTTNAFMALPELLQLVNSHLVQIVGAENDFVTIFAADLDFAAESMEYINAGHCPGLLRVNGDTIRKLQPMAPLLGFFEIDFECATVSIPSPAELFLYTDGFYEWERSPGELLDPDDFFNLASHTITESNADNAEFLDRLMENLTTLAQDQLQFRDDLTAVWVKTETDHD